MAMNSIWQYANPKRFMTVSGYALPPLAVASAAFLIAGLYWGFFLTPEDFKQGTSVKIMFVHVPSVIMATGTWFMMLIASLIWYVRRHHVSALAAKAAAPIGMTFTLMGLATGAIWGQPTWGTWWEWDPQLTSFLILFLFYLGYMALWEAIEEPDTAADLTAVLCVVGSIFALLSRYAVLFWSQGIHQAASFSLDKEENVDNAYALPLLICFIGFMLLFITLLLLRTRAEIRLRRVAALEARERMSDA
ncbi:transcriptional regulator [Actibacterium mucosum KCTC 23349]|uniref:Heme exporter protein C n=1 Tax=Actibacterium mucosum KCTC 23349 TaxID=1454373 RepID=A0A037ZDL7_9RHOB|nr:heme ABC transporter permease CcmC [Actibacterium mucosum]KAJ54574.1 transcriptional regulator [Actibacterium mucosum KCTC 23349]